MTDFRNDRQLTASGLFGPRRTPLSLVGDWTDPANTDLIRELLAPSGEEIERQERKTRRRRLGLVLFWVVWAALLGAILAVYLHLGRGV